MENLDQLRVAINEVDEAILELFIKREEICKKIGQAKREIGKPVLDTAREKEKLDRSRERAADKLTELQVFTAGEKACVVTGAVNLTEALMAEGRRIQNEGM